MLFLSQQLYSYDPPAEALYMGLVDDGLPLLLNIYDDTDASPHVLIYGNYDFRVPVSMYNVDSKFKADFIRISEEDCLNGNCEKGVYALSKYVTEKTDKRPTVVFIDNLESAFENSNPNAFYILLTQGKKKRITIIAKSNKIIPTDVSRLFSTTFEHVEKNRYKTVEGYKHTVIYFEVPEYDLDFPTKR